MPHISASLSSVPIVHVLDDDAAIRELVIALVQGDGIEARAYDNAERFLRDYRPASVECLVVDMRMPGLSGLDVQHRLNQSGQMIPVIFVTGYGQVGTAVEAMRAGALDYIEKPFAPEALLVKIHTALQRSRDLHEQRLAQSTIDARLSLLTPKEREVAVRVASGKSSREIADEFGLSVRTVENHRARIMDKLHASSVVDLVRLLGPRATS